MASQTIEGFQLSPQQKHLWLLSRDDPAPAYCAQCAVSIHGRLDAEILQAALQNVVNRHEILRATFHGSPGSALPVQVIMDGGAPSLQHYDLTNSSLQEQEARIEALLREARREPFDLERLPLVRASLAALSPRQHVLLVSLPALCMDPTAIENLVREISRAYAADLHGQALSDEPVQYADLAEWQNALLTGQDAREGIEFWRKKNVASQLDFRLPFENQLRQTSRFEPELLVSAVDAAIVAPLEAAAKKHDAAVSTFLLACWQVLLWRFAAQSDVVIGVAFDGRDYTEIEAALGLLDKYLPLDGRLEAHLPFGVVLDRAREALDEARGWQEYFTWQHAAAPGSDGAREPFFPACFAFEEQSTAYPAGDVTFSICRQYTCVDRFKIKLVCVRRDDALTAELHYDSNLFSATDVSCLAEQFQTLLKSAVAKPTAAIGELDILSDAERQRLLFALNEAQVGYAGDRRIEQWFEERAARAPDSVAIVFQDQQLSYAEVNARASQLARYLKNNGVGPDSLIAVMEDQTPDMIVTLLGILKAGGAYLPIDAQSPAERILYMLRDSRTNILLTRDRIVRDIPFIELQSLQDVGQDVTVTRPRPQIKDLNALPFPNRSLVDYGKYNRYIGEGCVKTSISIVTTRGCPYKCLYCHKLWPKSHVIRSAQDIFEEVLLHYDRGYRTFCFLDDVFNLNRRNSEAFFELVIKNNLKLRLLFPNGLRGDILTADYIDLMAEAGVIQIALALETASPRLQKLIGKNLDIEKLEENLVYICQKQPQIVLDLFTMFGFPTETEEEALMTLDFIKRIKWLHFPLVYALKIFPNTDMARLALEHGVTQEAIERSANLAFHEPGDTLPFSKSFVRKFQASFVQEYFLLPERLETVAPLQKKVLTREELLARYDAYLPGDLANYPEITRLLDDGDFFTDAATQDDAIPPSPVTLTAGRAGRAEPTGGDGLRVLLLDLSQHFSHEPDQLSNMVEAPLGLMYLLTYLEREFGDKVRGKILKSMIDFDDWEDLKRLIDDFAPQVIGIRTLSLYKNFFHQAVSLIKQWCPGVSIITGGPYATSEYATILSDRNVDVIVLGEGEVTFAELIEKTLANDGKLPEAEVLEQIAGLAFIPRRRAIARENAPVRQVLLLDRISDTIARERVSNPERTGEATNLAYVIYTSGSTGRPKGVMVSHANVVRLFAATDEWYHLNERDVWSLFHTYAFDFSVWELWGALFYGGRLVVTPYLVSRSPEEFYELLCQAQVTVLNQTPSAFRQVIWAEESMGVGADLALRLVIFGGEALELQGLKPWFERHGDCRPQLVNMYGITETTVHVTYRPLGSDDLETASGSRIGRPIPDLQVYVLDQRLQPAPIGVSGELYVGGAGLARGYLGRPALTAGRFIPHPFSTAPGERLYRTGDLARYWPDGDIEFVGRSDYQVKIRGFRIEPGEIEAVLRQQPAVRETVVMAREDQPGDKRLVAYVILRQGHEPSDSELARFLQRQLPEYMVPAAFVRLARLPLTPNGKLDRQALPAPGQARPNLDEALVAPRTPVEEILAGIWAEVLGLEQVGVYDNFFELGGDSILNVQVAARACQAGLQLTVKQLFQYQTIAELAAVVGTTQTIPVEQGLVTGPAPLTPIQHWFFEQDLAEPHHWNQAVLLEVRQALAPRLLEPAVKQLLLHHDALRLRFVREESDWKQFIADADETVSVAHVNLATLTEAEQRPALETIAAELQASLNLSQGPLLRVAFLDLGLQRPNYLLIIIHHLAVDGVSWRVLLADLQTAYEQLERGEAIQLPPKTTSFKRWAERLVEYASSATLRPELTYWLSETRVFSSLPVDRPEGREANTEASARTVAVSLDATETHTLLQEAPAAYGTQINDVLLTALVQAFAQWTGATSLHIDLEGHGREAILENVDLSRTVGWFTTLFPVSLELQEAHAPGDALKSIKERLRRIPNRGIGYGLLRYLNHDPEICGKLRDLGRSEVSFNYLGQLDRAAPAAALFALCREPVGPTHSLSGKRRYLLEVVASVLEERLQITWIYSENLYRRSTVEKLAHSFLDALRLLVAHCQTRTERSFTPSDFPLANLDQQKLDAVLAQVSPTKGRGSK